MTTAILAIDLSGYTSPYFEHGPRLNITQIRGGEAINIIPDRAECYIDIRLTPNLTPDDMIGMIGNTLRNLQLQHTDLEYELDITQREPAFLTDPKDLFVQILLKQAKLLHNPEIILATSGPGSIGNLIHQRFDIPIVNAFGLRSSNVHAPNEYIDVTTIESTYKTLYTSLVEWSKLEQ